jgi:asparagine synthetase B (glutamine-hydrolysing)
MIIAVWRSSAGAIPEPLSSNLAALLNVNGASRVETPRVTLAAWPPAHLEPGDGLVTGWAVSSGMRQYPGHPTIRLQGDGLVVAAPPLPQSPLYYVRAADDGYLLVSSRLEPLARLLPNAPVNGERLVAIVHGWARTVAPDQAATVFSGIRRLLPSEILTANADGIRADRILPRIARTYRNGRVEDLAGELREGLDAAIGRAVGVSKRVALLVSGGLDSSGMLALAVARFRGANSRELRAISMEFASPGHDRPYFDALVDALGVVPVRLPISEAGKWFRQSLCADAQPSGGSTACLEMLCCATATNMHADIALCGSAGDGICGGPLPFAQLVRRGHPLRALTGALRLRLPWPTTPWGRVRTYILRPFLPSAVLSARRRRADCAPWMTPRFLALLQACRAAAQRRRRAFPDTPDEWMQELCEGNSYVLPDMADTGGQTLATTGFSTYDVFLDFDFVRFMLEIDPIVLCHGDEYRGLYRLAMKGLIPETIRTRQDKAHFEPAVAAAAVAVNAHEMLCDLSSLRALAARDLVDSTYFRPMFERWLATVRRGERLDEDPGDERWEQVWQLLSVEAFLREHGGGRDLA